MPFVHGKNARLFVNSYELSAYFNKISSSESCDTPDVTVFRQNSHAYIPGLKEGSLSAEGLFDAASMPSTNLTLDEVITSVLGAASTIVLYSPSGQLAASQAMPLYGLVGTETTFEQDAPVDGVVTTALEVLSDEGRDRLIGHFGAAQTNTGSGSAVDNGTASANGGVGYCLGLTTTSIGLQGATVKVQHSVDNSVWVDLITFAAVPAGGGSAERKAVSGTVNRYTRANFTLGAAGTTPTIIVAFGRL